MGCSFDVFDDERTVLFGGVGRYFDRVLYDEILDESFRLQGANRTCNFSQHRLPRNGQPAIVWNDAYLSYVFGNRSPDGGCCTPVPGGYGNVLLSTDDKQTWYNEFGRSQQLSPVGEAFNIFDYENDGPASYNGNILAPGQPPDDAYGRPTQWIEPGRRLQLGATYSS